VAHYRVEAPCRSQVIGASAYREYAELVPVWVSIGTPCPMFKWSFIANAPRWSASATSGAVPCRGTTTMVVSVCVVARARLKIHSVASEETYITSVYAKPW